MTRLASFFAAFCVFFATSAVANDQPVVVELYTSQGCSSCPPADKLLHELAEMDDVIALSLHVDYWDYLGWKDKFASPAFTKRQHNYARALGETSVYTPQMIIGGTDHVVGSRPMKVSKLIQKHGQKPKQVDVVLQRNGSQVVINAASAQTQDMVVYLIRYSPRETVDVRRGENRGHTLTYANVVTDWQQVEEWDGAEPLRVFAQATGTAPVVVIVQRKGYRDVLGAAQLR
ncbi:thioredoxin family protein [Cognatishimia sp. MH4019]|uniref:DUF1223 domain-containing protein n=1 Tax=Cognatishimia sp. MH4019 TaxID=2854030 RepID=UPI001CD25903|nr:DUF1223 domain-containing protein [Cognatishimia sp. MH4019]